MRGMWETTSTRPTTARLAASTTVRTPAARNRGPGQPKNSASGQSPPHPRHAGGGWEPPRRSPRRYQDFGVHPTTSVAKWGGGEPGEAGIKQEDNFNAEMQREAQRKARGL